jgi:hypothetical protein
VTSSAIRLGTVAVFTVCLAVYAATLYPTVPGGDAGELIVVAQNLGVAHPPGYPLWTMLAWLATLVPAGSVAWRVAWVSAIPAAAAAATIFWSVASHLARSAPTAVTVAAGLIAAGCFALSPTAWLYAVGAEVFALHTFFCALLFALALAWERTRDRRVAIAIAFASGLGLTNHLTLVFYVAPIAAWVLWTGRRELWSRAVLFRLAAAAVAGLSPYAYLWIAGLAENPHSWGDTAAASGLVDHLLRRDYGTFQLLPPGHAESSSFLEKLFAYAIHFSDSTLGIIGFPLVAAAIVLTRAKGSFVLVVTACALAYTIVFLSLANVSVSDPFLLGVLERFWLQSDVALSIVAGIGLGLLAARAANAFVLGALIAVILLLQFTLGIGERIGRGDGVVESYARAIVDPLPPRTLLLTHGDLITNSVRYVQSAEGVRPDVVVLDQELLTKRWYVRRMAALHPRVRFPGERYHPGEAGGFSMKDFLDANGDRSSIAIYPEWKSGDRSVDGHWRAWPEGLASRVRPVNDEVDPSRWALESASALADVEARGWPAIDRYEKGSWERVVLEDVWQARHRRGVLLLTEAIAANDDAGLLTIAKGELEAAERMHPDPPAALFKNLGIVYSRLGPSQPWLRKQELAAWKRYLELTDPSDADRPAIEAQILQLEAK